MVSCLNTDIQLPMVLVLDGPVLADELLEARCIRYEAGEAVAFLHALLSTTNLLAVRCDADYRTQTRPILALKLIDPPQVVGNQNHPPLEPAVASVALVRCAEGSSLLLGVAKVSRTAEIFLRPFAKSCVIRFEG